MTTKASTAAAAHPSTLRPIFFVFCLALGLRLFFLAQWTKTPYSMAPQLDARDHHEWALSISHGQIIRERAFYGAPLYPYFLALVYALFGPHPERALFLQAWLGALACAFVFVSTRSCLGERGGLLAGISCAAYKPFIFHGALLTKEVLALFGLSLFVLFVLRMDQRRNASNSLACGLALGLTVLCRPNVALLLPAALAWLWARKSLDRRCAAACLLGFGLAVSPATLHNWLAAKDFVPVGYNAGFNLFLGNNPRATGLMTYPAGVPSDPAGEEEMVRKIAETSTGAPLKPSQVSSFWLRRGLAFIARNPRRWLWLTGRKFRLFWNWYEIGDDYNLQFMQRHFKTILRWPLLTFSWLAVLGACGMALRPKLAERLSLLPLLAMVYMLSVLVFYVSDRQRLAMGVFLFPLAAAALERVITAGRRREWSPLRYPAVAAAAMLPLCFSSPPYDRDEAEAWGWEQLAGIHHDQGQDRQAEAALDRALSFHRGIRTPAVVIKGAASLDRLGEPEKALQVCEMGMQQHPQIAMIYNDCAMLMFKNLKLEQAVEMLKKAVALDPGQAASYKGLSICYASLGRRDLAIRYGGMALALAPHDARFREEFLDYKRQQPARRKR